MQVLIGEPMVFVAYCNYLKACHHSKAEVLLRYMVEPVCPQQIGHIFEEVLVSGIEPFLLHPKVQELTAGFRLPTAALPLSTSGGTLPEWLADSVGPHPPSSAIYLNPQCAGPDLVVRLQSESDPAARGFLFLQAKCYAELIPRSVQVGANRSIDSSPFESVLKGCPVLGVLVAFPARWNPPLRSPPGRRLG
eukprot:GAFH01000032.1.p1 GENE.GAFH01000032.1~~GAFH01000032.1.p1  ORF type:complete len:192 (-),score=2.66 GAFH01000032.1:307-882(-)